MLETKLVIWDDLWYSAEISKIDNYHIDFSVFEVEGMGSPPSYKTETGDITEDHNKAKIMMKGFIKWDHCMNINFAEGNYPFHFCDKEQATRIGDVLGRLYDEAKKALVEQWD